MAEPPPPYPGSQKEMEAQQQGSPYPQQPYPAGAAPPQQQPYPAQPQQPNSGQPPPQQPNSGQPPPQQPYAGQGPPPQQPYGGQAPPPQQPYGGQAPPPQQPYGQPPPQQPYYQPQGGQTVVVTQPGPGIVTGVRSSYGPSPCTVQCNACHATVTTTTEKHCGALPWLVCGGICLVGLVTGGITWLGCCLIPFCIPDLYEVTHKCPNCDAIVGHHKKM